MPTTPDFPSIPVPTDDPKSLLESVNALKQTVEMLTGQDTTTDKSAAHTFVQASAPVALHVGDMWLCTSTVYSFNIWDGFNWLKIGNIATPTAQDQDPQIYLNLQQFMRGRR